jgi:hypothetical protein
MNMTVRLDLYSKSVLTVIALLLAMLVMRPSQVHADSNDSPAPFYVEPGTSPIRNLNGGVPGDGKVVINMTNGEVWGFPTHGAGAPYPIDALNLNNKTPIAKPVYLGKFDFTEIRRRSH